LEIIDERIVGGHISVGAMPRLYQVTPAILRRRRATQHPSVKPGWSTESQWSARRQPEDLRVVSDATAQRADSGTEKVKFVWRDGHPGCDPVGWVRVTDVAKGRRQELAACRAALPFEGLLDARWGVAPAPTFGPLVCQLATKRR
jgi:hypothetical protein